MIKHIEITSEEQMIEEGQLFSYSLKGGDTVHLSGELGVGKTTFVRGILKGMGHCNVVVSPTFSLVESYRLSNVDIHHFDLYRLDDEQEFELIGFRDYFTKGSINIIEWPQRAVEILAPADYDIRIKQLNEIRRLSIQ